jgi:hypothetical protein
MATLPDLDDDARAVLEALRERAHVDWPEPEVQIQVITIAPYDPRPCHSA